MRIASIDNEKIIREIESRRNFYDKLLNDEKGEYELNNQNMFKDSLLFLPEDERHAIFDALSTLSINNTDRLHDKISKHDKKIKLWRQSHPLDPTASHKKDSYFRPPEGEPLLYRDVSELSLPRIYKILNSLFKCIESLGGSVNDDLTLTIRNEIVQYKFSEVEEKVPHILTKDEQKAMERYEKDKLRYTYASKPNLRKWDYVFNGKLRFSVLKNKHYRDGESVLIEHRLPEMLIDLYEESENVRINREAREAAAKKAEEERKAKEHRQEIYNEEVEKVIALENEAEDYAIACKIRAYVFAVESQSVSNENTQEWIKWAREKADWYDPIIAKDDDVLGQRNHQQSKEEKALKKKNSYFWY